MAEMNNRLTRSLELINKKGLNGLIVYSGGTCSILAPSYLHYFCGCRPMGARNAAVVTKTGKPVLLMEPSWDAERVRMKSWIKDVRGSADFTRDLVRLLRRLGLAGPVGVAGSAEMTEEVYTAASSVVELQPADFIIEEMSREKSDEELEIVYDTARIADIGFETFVECARPGVREYELVAEMEFVMRAAGADDIFILLSSGPHNEEMHEPTDRRLRAGDIIIGEITPVREGQFMQLCRTVVLGEPAPVVREKYDMLLHAFRESLAAIKPGVEASAMSKAMNKVISDAGYAKYCYPPFMRARGHGFGVGSLRPGGAVDDETRVTFERQQVVVVHPNQYLPETGYLACGETFLVTDKGAEKLSKTVTKLHVKEV
ncbi:MAG TPA: Xaa-Pro peptidase family protein [Syntrophorhabdales bacterium]|nr:Xaa-Pro peptidase family protein [Syntrophorhabdales bacterium]